VRKKTEFQIYEKSHRSGRKSWIVSLGKVNGKRKTPAFPSLEAAQNFVSELKAKRALERPIALLDSILPFCQRA
jgi:hypothetical protein